MRWPARSSGPGLGEAAGPDLAQPLFRGSPATLTCALYRLATFGPRVPDGSRRVVQKRRLPKWTKQDIWAVRPRDPMLCIRCRRVWCITGVSRAASAVAWSLRQRRRLLRIQEIALRKGRSGRSDKEGLFDTWPRSASRQASAATIWRAASAGGDGQGNARDPAVFLFNESIVMCRLPSGREFCVITPGVTSIQSGDRVGLTIKSDGLHRFDDSTEAALAA